MNALLYADNTLPLAVRAICDLLNGVCRTVRFNPGEASVRIATPTIRPDITYKQLSKALLKEATTCDISFICTAVPYENNFFFEFSGKEILLSFAGWNLLTNLPISNGVGYFIASILCDLSGESKSHPENTGCINDFWWDKRGVDVGMRAAFLCATCRELYGKDRALLEDIDRLLDLVSTASRANRDVLSIGASSARGADAAFDSFLCHNGEDKPIIRQINTVMRASGIRTWFDEEQLLPGRPWQPELERQIDNVRSACVFVGDNGRGPWQDMEIRAFLSEFVRRGCPVIPVLLPDASSAPDLPLFLKQMMWVDLRREYDANLKRLIAAVHVRPVP
jgi:TIR domain-containing protein